MVLYNLVGLPGVLVASCLVESALGRRFTLAVALFGTTICIGLFASTQSELQLVLYSSLTNFIANSAWAALYTYSSEVYMTEIRSQGTGVAHAWHDLAGIRAPIVGGWVLHTHGPQKSL